MRSGLVNIFGYINVFQFSDVFDSSFEDEIINCLII